jgi:hypothetical protein
MEGSVLSFLKAEWKVSDTDSAHWASSLNIFWLVDINICIGQLHYDFVMGFQTTANVLPWNTGNQGSTYSKHGMVILEIDQPETRIAYGSHVW